MFNSFLFVVPFKSDNFVVVVLFLFCFFLLTNCFLDNIIITKSLLHLMVKKTKAKIFQAFTKHRSSYSEVFCYKGILESFTKFIGKHQPWNTTWLKKNFVADVFFEYYKFYQQLFYVKPPGNSFRKLPDL